MARGVVLALTLLTGFTGLVYEVAWQKYLATLLGSHSEATASVLGIFLGGLSVGYALFGALSRRLAARGRGGALGPLAVYGAVEASIGAWALCFPALFGVVQAVSLWIPPTVPGAAFALDVGLSALLIGPPSVLMGATIPLLTQALARSVGDSTRIHALIYASNTAGAFAGALAAGFFLVPALGLAGCVVSMGLVNVAVGGFFIALSRQRGRRASSPAAEAVARASIPPRTRFALAATALLAGFAMMTLQTTLNRIGALSLGASHFTFSIVVATFVFCIALGSFAVSAFARIHWSVLVVSQWALVLILVAAYPQVGDAPYYAHVIRSLFASHDGSFYPYQLSIFVGLFAVCLVPLALSGAMLPLLFHHLRGEVGDLGGVAGRLYSWNTVGSLLGALLGGYALFYWFDLHQIYRIAAIALAAGAAALTFVIRPRLALAAVAIFAFVIFAVSTQPAWDARNLVAGSFRMREAEPTTPLGAEVFFAHLAQRGRDGDFLLFYDDDPTMSVAVTSGRLAGQPTRSIVVNGKSDGNIPSDNQTTGLLALLPALFSAKAERAFVIGYGTGMSVGELVALDSIREVVVAEISTGVMQAAPLFEAANRGALSNPKTVVIRSDAYRALLRSEGDYDIIVSEPSNPWVTGVENIFALEFLEAASKRLRPGGVYAQWFHNYETNRESIELVLNTYRQVFERVSVWNGKADDLILLGFDGRGPAPGIDELVRSLSRTDFQRQLSAIGIDGIAALLAHEEVPLGVIHQATLSMGLHTLSHPRLSHFAARGFFTGGVAELPPMLNAASVRLGSQNSLLRSYAAHFGGRLPDELRAAFARAACRLNVKRCATVLAEWRHDAPDSAALRAVIDWARREESVRRELEGGKLEFLAQFFDAENFEDAASSYASSRQLTEAFADYYEHSTPFDIDVLSDIWWRCSGDDRCESVGARYRELGASRAAFTRETRP
ncbi:MAG: fused MFS/spermidine synthase [Deltaproteobacteria bacterium]|jgi:predicted membrane-bound spermidine synthase|nr:fused MFS/spermidine synthase [Deltaproteobacteria bacterium]